MSRNSEAQIAQLAASMKEWGWTRPGAQIPLYRAGA
jgi:hypothetical protein